MNKRLIRLTEGEIRRIVKESVEKIINENSEDAWEELHRAKVSGNVQAIINALHKLEAQLESEDKFVVGGNIQNGSWKSTNPKAFERDSRFTKTWEK